MRRLFIKCTGHGQTGARYRVTDENGHVVVDGSRNPEFDAARVLSAEGVTGDMEVWRPAGAFPSMRIDIEKAARLSVVEGATIGPIITQWKADNRHVVGEGDDERASAVR
jgi:hypothetical protein